MNLTCKLTVAMWLQTFANKLTDQKSFHVEGAQAYEWPDQLEIWIEPDQNEDFAAFQLDADGRQIIGPAIIKAGDSIPLSRPLQVKKAGTPYPAMPTEQHIKFLAANGCQIPTLFLVAENQIYFLFAGQQLGLPETSNEVMRNTRAALENRNEQIGFKATEVLKQKIQDKRRKVNKEKAAKERNQQLHAARKQIPFSKTDLANEAFCEVADFVKELDFGKDRDTVTKAANALFPRSGSARRKKWRFSTEANPNNPKGISDAERLYKSLIRNPNTPRTGIESAIKNEIRKIVGR